MTPRKTAHIISPLQMNSSECFPTYIIFPHAWFPGYIYVRPTCISFLTFQTKKYFLFSKIHYRQLV